MPEVDTTNHHLVTLRGDGYVLVMRPPYQAMEPDAALAFAAWIVALADPTGEKFPAVLDAIRST